MQLHSGGGLEILSVAIFMTDFLLYSIYKSAIASENKTFVL
jgi:hypothetical protein